MATAQVPRKGERRLRAEPLLLLANVASLTPQPQTFSDSLQLWVRQWPGGRFGQGWLGEEGLGDTLGLTPPREHLVALVQYK